MLDKLCEEYDLKLAIHDHPKPTRYWNPDFVLRVCRDRSHRIGACADTGHWMRSGLNPVECLKKLEGRLISFHFKDLNKAGGDAHDVPWGTGACNVPAMLAERIGRESKRPSSSNTNITGRLRCRKSPSQSPISTRCRPNWRPRVKARAGWDSRGLAGA